MSCHQTGFAGRLHSKRVWDSDYLAHKIRKVLQLLLATTFEEEAMSGNAYLLYTTRVIDRMKWLQVSCESTLGQYETSNNIWDSQRISWLWATFHQVNLYWWDYKIEHDQKDQQTKVKSSCSPTRKISGYILVHNIHEMMLKKAKLYQSCTLQHTTLSSTRNATEVYIY